MGGAARCTLPLTLCRFEYIIKLKGFENYEKYCLFGENEIMTMGVFEVSKLRDFFFEKFAEIYKRNAVYAVFSVYTAFCFYMKGM